MMYGTDSVRRIMLDGSCHNDTSAHMSRGTRASLIGRRNGIRAESWITVCDTLHSGEMR